MWSVTSSIVSTTPSTSSLLDDATTATLGDPGRRADPANAALAHHAEATTALHEIDADDATTARTGYDLGCAHTHLEAIAGHGEPSR